ncbi:MAG TPA: DeoR/GlpR family DNA-binding transcription regulator [Chloroflexota bacterium]|nr:DeoR/GlpR family DNA-binding transcription regulator [Chloroflexota bacterium]
MLKEERQRYILQVLRQDGKLSAMELCARLGVSGDTIRRDLDELAAASALQRVHGGALPRPAVVPFDLRDREADQAKAAIADLAVELLRDGQVIIMDSGATVLAVARRLPLNLRATVITTSIPVAAVLTHHPLVSVHLTGGSLKKDAQSLVGVPAVEALHGVHADLCLLGICSLHFELGLSVSDPDEAYVKRAMVRNAALVVALAGAEKIGTAEPYVVSPVSALTHLITDRTVPEPLLAPYRSLGLTILQG